MRRFSLPLALALIAVPAALLAATDKTAETEDRALTSLASGRPADAVALLKREVAAAKDDPARNRLRCLLGKAQRLGGDPAAAAVTLALVPRDAPCGLRAAYDRADALLATGRTAEAAALYEELGTPALGPDRDAASADDIVELARRVLEDPEGNHGQAISLYRLALGLELTDARRLALAKDLAALLLPEPGLDPAAAAEVVTVLHAALATRDDADLRRLLARLDGSRGLPAVASLPDDGPTLLARAAAALSWDGELALLYRGLALAKLEGEPAKEAARAQADALVAANRYAAAPLLEGLAAGTDEAAAAAAWQRALLDVRAGDLDAAIPRLEAWLARYPSGSARAEVEATLDDAHLERGRRAYAAGSWKAAIADLDALVARNPLHDGAALASYEAGLAARAAGDAAEAKRRWEEVLARWPGSYAAERAVDALARTLAFDEGKPEAAIDWLRRRSRAGDGAAGLELERLRTKQVAVTATRQDPDRKPTVRVVARNLTEVEVRLHRIDTEAFVRNGGTPEGLPLLDVAVIAPDRRWTAPVPDPAPGRDIAWDVPVDAKPGLYAVTVAGGDHEAHAILLVSDVSVVARAVGPDLAVAVFRDGAPAPGARVLVDAGGLIREGRTDRTGLYRSTIPGGAITVLAEDGGAPALLSVARDEGYDASQGTTTSIDLDRPVYRPGDSVGFRFVARRDGAPLTGTWKLWLDGAASLDPVSLKADARGAVTGEIALPPSPTGFSGGGPTGASWTLYGLRAGEADPIALATVSVADEGPPVRRIAARMDGDAAVIEVREADGSPADGVAVTYESDAGPDGVAATDAAGRVRLVGPPEGLPWHLDAAIAGTGVGAVADRALDYPDAAMRLSTAQDLLRPGEAPAVLLASSGPSRVTVSRLVVAPDPAAALSDPWVPEPATGLSGPISWWAGGPELPVPAAEIDVWSADVAGGEPAPLALPALEAGRYLVRAVSSDGAALTATLALRVDATAVRVTGARDAAAGETLSIRADGGPALLTAESDRLLAAAVSGPGEPVPWKVSPEWSGVVAVSATSGTGGVHQREITVDGALDVDLSVTPAGDTWVVRARVTNGAGAPVSAQVALRGLDQVLLAAKGGAMTLESSVVSRQVLQVPPSGGVAAELTDGAWGVEVSAALLAEVAREEEASRAARAQSGMLSSNALQSAFEGQSIITSEYGSIGYGAGAAGYGSGGGGMGYGAGMGGVGYGRSRAQAIPGERARVLWAVLETDRDGVATLTVPRPSRSAVWKVQASALSADAVGHANVTTDEDHRVFLAVTSPEPGAPTDRARARITVVNRTAAPLKAVLEADGPHPVDVAAGASAVVDLGERAPGVVIEASLTVDGQVADRDTWAFPLRAGVPAAGGDVVTVAIGPGGGPPMAWLALDEDAGMWREAPRAAIAGRSALAALPWLSGAEREQALERIRDARRVISTYGVSGTAAEVARIVLFLAEAKPLLGIPHGDVDEALVVLGYQAVAPEDRLEVAWAKARAGASVDETALSLLVREAAALDDEESSLLARLLVATKSPGAEALVRGSGPQAVLARRELKLRAAPEPVSGGPFAPGDARRPDWIAALGGPAGKAKGVAEVRVGGAIVGSVDLGKGGVVRIATDQAPEVSVPALVIRGQSAPAGTDFVHAGRVPVGADGWPVSPIAAYSDTAEPVWCGADGPCALAPGDRLRVPYDLFVPGFEPPAGLVRDVDPQTGEAVLTAVTPGRYTLAGLVGQGWVAPLEIVIADEPPAIGQIEPTYALGLALQEAAAGGDGTRWLPADLSEWPALLAPAAQLRFDRALAEEAPAADVVARFEELRVANASADVGFEEVAAVARAYLAIGKADRAVHVWRAGLGAAFLDEAASARALEDIVGRLASLRAMRDVTRRYPEVPVVVGAVFQLPEQLGAMADTDLPIELVSQGVTATDLRLMAAAWDREFLALHPDSPLVPQAGFHLVQGLLRLQAWEQAADWARRTADAHPESPLLDSMVYLEGLARSEMGDDARALVLFERIGREEFPYADGTRGPATTRDDATYAAARLQEARGNISAAQRGYEEVAGTFPEAGRTLAAMKRVRLEPDALVRLEAGEAAKLPLLATNLDEVHLRAYRIDLRTIFLRDSGLSGVAGIAVAGVSPTWSGVRRVGAGLFPEEMSLDLPLQGEGAWLVQLDGGGLEASALVVRSSLRLDVDDSDVRRLTVRERDGKPAAGVAVRAVGGSGVTATQTDLRGVAIVPAGAAVLVFRGDDTAFTDPAEATYGYGGSPAYGAGDADLYQRMNQRLEEQRSDNEAVYEQTYSKQKKAAVGIDAL